MQHLNAQLPADKRSTYASSPLKPTGSLPAYWAASSKHPITPPPGMPLLARAPHRLQNGHAADARPRRHHRSMHNDIYVVGFKLVLHYYLGCCIPLCSAPAMVVTMKASMSLSAQLNPQCSIGGKSILSMRVGRNCCDASAAIAVIPLLLMCSGQQAPDTFAMMCTGGTPEFP